MSSYTLHELVQLRLRFPLLRLVYVLSEPVVDSLACFSGVLVLAEPHRPGVGYRAGIPIQHLGVLAPLIHDEC